MQDGGSNSGVEMEDSEQKVFKYGERYEGRGPKKLTGRKRGERAERNCKKALSLRTGDAPERISEPADQQFII